MSSQGRSSASSSATPSPATVCPEVPAVTQPRGNAAAAEAVAERESPELGDTLAVLNGKLLAILDLRKTAIRRLGEDAEPVEPPPAWQSIALAVGAIALSAATAGVATAVSGAIATAALGTRRSRPGATSLRAPNWGRSLGPRVPRASTSGGRSVTPAGRGFSACA